MAGNLSRARRAGTSDDRRRSRLAGRALRAQRLHAQHRRPHGPLERRPPALRPPPRSAATPEAPQEELTSLVYFHDCAPHTDITSLPAPLGRRPHNSVRAGDYLHHKRRTILGRPHPAARRPDAAPSATSDRRRTVRDQVLKHHPDLRPSGREVGRERGGLPQAGSRTYHIVEYSSKYQRELNL